MAVDVHGRLDRRVAELLLDVVQRFALLQEEAGEGVPHVVEANLLDVGLLENLSPWVSPEPTRIDLLAGVVREEKLDLGLSADGVIVPHQH